MFGISFPLLTILLLWGALFYHMVNSGSRFAVGLKPRMFTLLGIILVVGSFFFQNWLRLSFLAYWTRVPEALEKYVPIKLVSWLTELLGAGWISFPLQWFEKLTSIKGWMVMLSPTYSIGLHLVMFAPLLVALMALVWLPFGAWRPGTCIGKGVGVALCVLSLSCAMALLLCLPEIDAAGLSRSFQGALVTTLLGMRMGNGPWLMLLGLIFLAVGGVVEVIHLLPVQQSELEGEQ